MLMEGLKDQGEGGVTRTWAVTVGEGVWWELWPLIEGWRQSIEAKWGEQISFLCSCCVLWPPDGAFCYQNWKAREPTNADHEKNSLSTQSGMKVWKGQWKISNKHTLHVWEHLCSPSYLYDSLVEYRILGLKWFPLEVWRNFQYSVAIEKLGSLLISYPVCGTYMCLEISRIFLSPVVANFLQVPCRGFTFSYCSGHP